MAASFRLALSLTSFLWTLSHANNKSKSGHVLMRRGPKEKSYHGAHYKHESFGKEHPTQREYSVAPHANGKHGTRSTRARKSEHLTAHGGHSFAPHAHGKQSISHISRNSRTSEAHSDKGQAHHGHADEAEDKSATSEDTDTLTPAKVLKNASRHVDGVWAIVPSLLDPMKRANSAGTQFRWDLAKHAPVVVVPALSEASLLRKLIYSIDMPIPKLVLMWNKMPRTLANSLVWNEGRHEAALAATNEREQPSDTFVRQIVSTNRSMTAEDAMLASMSAVIEEATMAFGDERFLRVYNNAENRGFGASFNQAWRDPALASYNLFLCISADVVLMPGVLAQFTEQAAKPEAQATLLWENCQHETCHDSFSYFAVRRSLFEKQVGYFDENFGPFSKLASCDLLIRMKNMLLKPGFFTEDHDLGFLHGDAARDWKFAERYQFHERLKLVERNDREYFITKWNAEPCASRSEGMEDAKMFPCAFNKAENCQDSLRLTSPPRHEFLENQMRLMDPSLDPTHIKFLNWSLPKQWGVFNVTMPTHTLTAIAQFDEAELPDGES